jgi:hypothetical protein
MVFLGDNKSWAFNKCRPLALRPKKRHSFYRGNQNKLENLYRTLVPRGTAPPAAHIPRRHSGNSSEPTGPANCRVLAVALNNDHWKDPSWQTNTPTKPPEATQKAKHHHERQRKRKGAVSRRESASTPGCVSLSGSTGHLRQGNRSWDVTRPLKARLTSQRRPLINVGVH